MALTTLWGALVCYLSAYACLDSNGTAKGAAPSAINPTTTPGPALFNGQFTWKSQAQLNLWSWAQPMGSYQAYLRNDKQPMARYIRVSERYGRPGIAAFGARFLLDSTSYLPNSTQSRTELLPQFKPPLSYNGYQNGLIVYHWSVAMGLEPDVPRLATDYEHWLTYTDAHFADLKYGTISGYAAPGSQKWLQFFIRDKLVWLSDMPSGRWHNFALAVDYDASTVELWYSLGRGALNRVVNTTQAPVNRADWHVGVLRMPLTNGQQLSMPTGLYYSLIWIEQGQITTNIAQ